MKPLSLSFTLVLAGVLWLLLPSLAAAQEGCGGHGETCYWCKSWGDGGEYFHETDDEEMEEWMYCVGDIESGHGTGGCSQAVHGTCLGTCLATHEWCTDELEQGVALFEAARASDFNRLKELMEETSAVVTFNRDRGAVQIAPSCSGRLALQMLVGPKVVEWLERVKP